MARPKQYHEARVTTAIRLPESIHSALSAEAKAQRVSVNRIVTSVVSEYLNSDRAPVDNLPDAAQGTQA